ncbi:alpha/beta fold hydrolase [Rhodococcus sp. 5G237]
MARASSTLVGPAESDVPPAVLVHGVLAWGDDETYGFGRQRPLGASRRLILMDRRGHGNSPDLDGAHRTDYEVDAADIVELLGDGAHLVGHSYGAVAAMLAAAERPDLVRSLCLIQPGCLKVAESEPVVAENLARARASQAALPPELTAEDYLRLTTESVGMPPAEPTPKRLRAAATSMRERPCWDADIPLEPLAAAPWPKLVVIGDWAGAPDEYKRLAGDPLTITARVVANRIDGELLEVPGFYPHVQQPETVNEALDELWSRADAR